MNEDDLNNGVYNGDYNVYVIPYFLSKFYFESLLGYVNDGISPKKGLGYIENLSLFARAKAQSQILELQSGLIAYKKKVTRGLFNSHAAKINKKYAEWLRVESEQVELISESAENWESIVEDKNVKYLKYRTIGDGRVRPKHAAWNGIIKPVNDPFWNTRYPPNDWSCRCSVSVLKSGDVTNLDKHKKEFNDKQVIGDREKVNSLVNDSKEFSHNWGKVDYIFDKSHPYFKTARKYKLR